MPALLQWDQATDPDNPDQTLRACGIGYRSLLVTGQEPVNRVFRISRRHLTGQLQTLPTALAANLALIGVFAPPMPGQSGVDFATDLFPRLEAHNCRACHNASGVASGTRLHFPEPGAAASVIAQFGMGLESLVDRAEPSESLLLKKPTNRVPHTGGPLIAVGSDDEELLTGWVEHLASIPASQTPISAQRGSRPAEPLRRLTHNQYDNSVRDLLGDRTRPGRSFPTEDYVNGYTNQASSQAITPILVEAYGSAAEKLARNAFRYGDEQELLPCAPRSALDRDCAEAFVRKFGARAYRRPLEPEEVETYTDVVVEWGPLNGGFLAGAALAVETMLQSPHFLFLAPQASRDGPQGFATAARLSYALLNTLPDEELFAAAAQARLETKPDVEREAKRLLRLPAARDTFDEFFSQWLRFDRLRNAVKDRNRFRDYSQGVAESMAEESLRLFRYLAWQNIDFRELFSADYTFVDDFLTVIYDMPDPEIPFGRTAYLDGSPRGGILGHGTFLAQTGKPVNTSPTERGLYVREHFLCQTIPPPPPGVDASLPPLLLGARPMTIRETMESMHASEEACASCHKLVDPIGFGFEHFDTVGAYRTTEQVRVEPTPQQERQGMKAQTHDLAIDATGYIAGIEESTFRTPREAGQILANSKVCQKCVVKQLFRYLFGRHERKDDTDLIDRAYNRFERSGFLFQELVLGLVVTEEYLQVDWSE